MFLNYGTIGIRLNNHCRQITILLPLLRDQIIGHMLGDGCIVYSKTSIIPYFQFIQALQKVNYLMFSFNYLSLLCESLPKGQSSIRRGKNLFAISFRTRSYPFLLKIHNLFYKKINGNWVKYISNDLIFYLSPRVLAFWFMDDGAKAGTSVYLHTKGFTLVDVYKLAGMLHYKFGLNVTVQIHDNRPVIYIKAKSFQLFKSLVMPHMHSSMYYKLGM